MGKPMVLAGIYPVDTEDYEGLRNSMEKLQLNDASLLHLSPNLQLLWGLDLDVDFRECFTWK